VSVLDALKTSGVPEPERIQVRAPASRMVAPASPDFPILRTEETVMVPVPAWAVMVGVPAERPKVRVTKFQLLLPEVVPKFFEAPTLCSNVPAD
jgi:hypothetical protein